MKYFLMFILLLPAFVYSQDNNYDLLDSKQIFNSQINWLNDFDLYFSLNNIQNDINNIPSDNNPKTIGLWTSYAVSKTYVVETMPGETAQTAAVGYMAYIHLKKYGFLK